MRPWDLAAITLKDVRSQARDSVAVLPFGATEPHNEHLPYGTDTFQVDALADRACAAAHAAGANVLRLPTIPYGTETNQREFPLAMNLNPTTLAAIVTDLVATLAHSGVRKCLLLNGHGGNDFKWLLRQLYGTTPVHLFLCRWYTLAAERQDSLFQDPGDHAGEMETSMGLAHFPDLVHMDWIDPAPLAHCRLEGVRRGEIEMTRPWHLLTPHSGVGDPRPATAEKGRILTDLVVERIAAFLVELSSSPIDESFPY